MIQCLATFTR